LADSFEIFAKFNETKVSLLQYRNNLVTFPKKSKYNVAYAYNLKSL